MRGDKNFSVGRAGLSMHGGLIFSLCGVKILLGGQDELCTV